MYITYTTAIISILAFSFVVYDRVTRWMSKKPVLHHDMYYPGKGHRRFMQARLIVWDEEGNVVQGDADETCTPGFYFTLLSRSSEPVEIYDVEFSHLSVRKAGDPDYKLISSVSLPNMLKPYDYQNFHISVAGEFEKSQMLRTWNNRQSIWLLSPSYPLSNARNIEVRTSRGVIKATVRGFSKSENRKRRLASKLYFARREWQRKAYLKIPKLRGFLEGKNWWE